MCAPNKVLNIFLVNPINPITFKTNKKKIKKPKLNDISIEKIPISNKNFIVKGNPEKKTQLIKIKNEKKGIVCTRPVI